MTSRRALVLVVGLFLVVMIAGSVQGSPEFTPRELPWPNMAIDPPSAEETPESDLMTDPPQPAGNRWLGVIMAALLIAVAVAAAAALLYAVVRLLLRLWRERAGRKREGSAVGVETATRLEEDAGALASVVRRGVAGALDQIAQHPHPADAIIAAWVGLEETASDAGIVRARTETPAEFTLRLISGRTSISSEAAQLLRLYEQVRFGGRDATVEDRRAARRTLEAIEEAWR